MRARPGGAVHNRWCCAARTSNWTIPPYCFISSVKPRHSQDSQSCRHSGRQSKLQFTVNPTIPTCARAVIDFPAISLVLVTPARFLFYSISRAAVLLLYRELPSWAAHASRGCSHIHGGQPAVGCRNINIGDCEAQHECSNTKPLTNRQFYWRGVEPAVLQCALPGP